MVYDKGYGLISQYLLSLFHRMFIHISSFFSDTFNDRTPNRVTLVRSLQWFQTSLLRSQSILI